ncbi:hypothetical protein IV203_017156 [Nitzschia inconspicua]|uniref:Uncharacterized protein n=1 Tax=Nitzschia inconspicua TaxID=303405 RepID=A0A9K3KRZ6_9STRA|nr:hypothetical protein IV203_017156 [Nitzschia inconspicua]
MAEDPSVTVTKPSKNEETPPENDGISLTTESHLAVPAKRNHEEATTAVTTTTKTSTELDDEPSTTTNVLLAAVAAMENCNTNNNKGGADDELPPKRSKREWLAFHGVKHSRVGSDYQVAVLPSIEKKEAVDEKTK